MNTACLSVPLQKERLFRRASALALFTIFYNIAEGLVSVFFGIDDETIALFGFGLDSFVEVVSGAGIWHMINRFRRDGSADLDRFEERALRITGTSFYVLTVGLSATSLFNLIQGRAPVTTFWGVVVSLVSILTMWLLFHHKVKVGRQLDSPAILSDANCTKTCMQLSFVLLLSSVGFEITGIGGLDSAGALVIAWFSFREGRESFEKARNRGSCRCSADCREPRPPCPPPPQ